MTRPSRHLLAFLAIAGIAVSACGSDDSSDAAPANTGGSTAASTAAPSAELPSTIRIGYQNIPNGDLVVKRQGLLEKAFGPDVTIEWSLFDSGGSVNEAIVGGSLDIGLVGSSPASRGLSSGIEYQVPWIHDVIGKAEALVVRDGIGSIADLKGKTIATPFASTAHYSLLAALADAGVAETDVKIIDSEPDAIYAGWQQGDIDGAYVWNPNLAKLVADGGKVLITSEDLSRKGKTTYDLAVVTNAFASKYPAAVQTWVAAQDQAVQLIQSDPTAAAELIAAELNITPTEAEQQLSELIFLRASEQVGADYLGGGLATNLFAAAKFNQELGKIDTVQPEETYRQGVVTTFAAGVK